MHSIRSQIAAGAATVVMAMTLAAVVSTPALAASEDVTWGVRAADNDHGSERQNFSYQVEAGEAVEDTIEVTNHGAAPLALAVYAADGFTTSSGQLDVLTSGGESTEIGVWTTIGADTITLDPGESEQIPFQLVVPENASPGDYAGAILTSLQTSQGSGVSVDRRLGIRIHLQVGGEIAPALAIDEVVVHYDAALWPFVVNPATVDIFVRNTGNARLAANQTATVSGLFWESSSVATDVPELLPGEKWNTTVGVNGVFPSLYVTAGGELVPIRPDDEALDAVTAKVGVWAVPWVLIGLIVLAALIATALVRTARNRRRHAKHMEEQRIADAVDAALHERDSAEV